MALIDYWYRQHGDRVWLPGADADLLNIEASYAGRGGAFVVLEDESHRVLGSHATLPVGQGTNLVTFRRLYLAPHLLGSGAGAQLFEWALGWSRESGFKRVEFWSDTRFARAHHFFEKFGFRRDGRHRVRHDGDRPYSEYGFFLQL